MRIAISIKENTARELDDETVQTAINSLYTDGYVVLGNVIDQSILDAMRLKLEEDTFSLIGRIGLSALKKFHGHISQPMPRSKDYIYSDIVTNPFIVQITSRMLGKGVHSHFYNCNTNLPGSQYQDLHRDAPLLEIDPINPFTSLIVNVSTVGVTELNGATELWPGTHRIIGSTIVTKDDEEKWKSKIKPIRMLSYKGDIVLRDPRMWHRGVPNASSEIRHMIAMVHSKWYYMRETTIPVTNDARHSFDHEVLNTRVTIVPDNYDYLAESICLPSS